MYSTNKERICVGNAKKSDEWIFIIMDLFINNLIKIRSAK